MRDCVYTEFIVDSVFRSLQVNSVNTNEYSMSSVLAQITSLYEQGVSVEDISSELDLEIEAVKTALAQHSSKYRQNLKQNEEVFSDQDFELARDALKSCLYSEEDSTRFRAARFIINERKGRNDLVKNLQQIGSMNILIINRQMLKAKQALEKSKSEIIDIPSEKLEQNVA